MHQHGLDRAQLPVHRSEAPFVRHVRLDDVRIALERRRQRRDLGRAGRIVGLGNRHAERARSLVLALLVHDGLDGVAAGRRHPVRGEQRLAVAADEERGVVGGGDQHALAGILRREAEQELEQGFFRVVHVRRLLERRAVARREAQLAGARVHAHHRDAAPAERARNREGLEARGIACGVAVRAVGEDEGARRRHRIAPVAL